MLIGTCNPDGMPDPPPPLATNVLQDIFEDILHTHGKNDAVFNQARHFCDDKSICITTL